MKTSYYVCVILKNERDNEQKWWEHQYEQPVPIPEVGEVVTVVGRDEQDGITVLEFEVVRRDFDFCDGLIDRAYRKSVQVNLYVRPAKEE